MKTTHFKKTLTDFNILPTRYDTKNLHWRLRQGQATRLSACYPAQRLSSDWGRQFASPNALKTGHSKQTFPDFNVLPTRYDTKKRIGASTKARRRTFQRIAWPSVQQPIGVAHCRHQCIENWAFQTNLHNFSHFANMIRHKKRIAASAKARRRAFLHIAWPNVRWQGKRAKIFGKQRISPSTVERPRAPPPSSAPHALTGTWRCCSDAGALVESINLQNTNTSGGTTPHTFVGTKHGCGFHPSNVDG